MARDRRPGRGRQRHAQELEVSAIPYEAGQFNLNGIVKKGADKLVVVNSFNGKLYRIDLSDAGDAIEAIDEIEGATVPGGDGMLLDRGKLVVVQGGEAQLAFLELSAARARRSSSARRRVRNSAARRRSTRPSASTSW